MGTNSAAGGMLLPIMGCISAGPGPIEGSPHIPGWGTNGGMGGPPMGPPWRKSGWGSRLGQMSGDRNTAQQSPHIRKTTLHKVTHMQQFSVGNVQCVPVSQSECSHAYLCVCVCMCLYVHVLPVLWSPSPHVWWEVHPWEWRPV